MYPDTYESPRHLPFNRSCLDELLDFLPPEHDPGSDGYWVILGKGRLAVSSETGQPCLPDGVAPPLSIATEPVYIGQWNGRPCRVAALNDVAGIPEPFEMHSIMAAEPRLPLELLTLAGVAGQVLHWARNSLHCGRCGSRQKWIDGEWGKVCSQCNIHHFPHIHPCVIVVVRRPGELLLTRKADWPEGRYSLVAGFLDMGECLEEAVVREVREETGVDIEHLRYIGSQNWPFPSQLMTGFVADYVSGDIRIDEEELEDVRWFPVEDLPLLPPKRSISRYLIDHFKKME